MTRLLMAVFFALSLAWSVPAFAGPTPEYGQLGLSADQMKDVRELHQEINQRLSALERQLREQRRALEAVYAAYDLDTAKARQLNARINEIQQAILDQNLRLQTGMRRILTEEQFQRLRAMVEQHRQRLRDRARERPKR